MSDTKAAFESSAETLAEVTEVAEPLEGAARLSSCLAAAQLRASDITDAAVSDFAQKLSLLVDKVIEDDSAKRFTAATAGAYGATGGCDSSIQGSESDRVCLVFQVVVGNGGELGDSGCHHHQVVAEPHADTTPIATDTIAPNNTDTFDTLPPRVLGSAETAVRSVAWPERGLRWHSVRHTSASLKLRADVALSLVVHQNLPVLQVACSLCAIPACIESAASELGERVVTACGGPSVCMTELLVVAPCPVPLLSANPAKYAYGNSLCATNGGSFSNSSSNDKLNSSTAGTIGANNFNNFKLDNSTDVLGCPTTAAAVSAAAKQFRRDGLLTCSAALSNGEVCSALAEAQALIKAADQQLKARGHNVGTDIFKYREIGSRGGQRFDLLFNLEASAVANEARKVASMAAAKSTTATTGHKQKERHDATLAEIPTSTITTTPNTKATTSRAAAIIGVHDASPATAKEEVKLGDNNILSLAQQQRQRPISIHVAHLATAGPWVPLIDALLGGPDSHHVWVSVVYSRPGAPHQGWHADGPHVAPDVGWSAHLDDGNAAAAAAAAATATATTTTAAVDGHDAKTLPAPPYAVCVFVPLIDLSPEVGFTRFWPGTHAYAGLRGFGGAAEGLGLAVDCMGRAGDCVLYDYRLLHRGMPNRSEATERPLLQFFYHQPAYRETKNYGHERLFDGET